MALLSVLLPNYNNESFLKEALDSLFNQSFKDFIVYLVDDKSTDDSIKIAEGYKDDRLKIIRKESNSGIVDTLNLGLKEIRTKYTIRMDGDDKCHLDRFAILVEFMETHPDIDCCSSAIQTFGSKNETWNYESDINMNKANLIFSHSIGHASSIFRTKVLQENTIEYSNEFKFMEDYHIFYLMKDFAKMTAIADPLYFYRLEEYNDYTEKEIVKEPTFKRFYQMVLSDLGLSCQPGDIEIHYELSRKKQFSFPFRDYESHVKKILFSNEKLGCYPQKELELVLFRNLQQLAFLMIDNKHLGLSGILKSEKNKKLYLKYFFSKKIKS